MSRLICWLVGCPKMLSYFLSYSRQPDGSYLRKQLIECPRCKKEYFAD
jgi:hypothetical protein